MGKVIKYNLCTNIDGNDVLNPITMGWNEINEETAKREAHNGEYTIEDDGKEEPVTSEARIAELEEALDMILNEVTE